MKRKREDEESSGGVLKKSNICRFEDCTTRSSYGYVDGDNKRATRCKDHQLPKMVNVVSKRCETPGCNNHPIYAELGKPIAFCKKCKKDGMVDVTHKRCQQSGCIMRPSYAKPGENIPAYCATHMVPGEMIDVRHKRCQKPGCDKIPTFAGHGETIPAFCKDHQLPDMVDVKNKRCQQSGCDKRPSFAKHGEKIPAYCADHMVSGEMINVTHKRCQQSGCPTRARFGYLTFPPERCAQHQDEKNPMVFNPTARCIIKGCRGFATSGKASKRQHCSEHAQPGEVSFAKQMCIGPNKTGCYEMAMLSPKSQLCVGCDPNYSMVKHVKMEENAVRSLLLHNGYSNFVYDKVLPDNCGMTYRPDFLFQEPGFFVILEVDEHQHKNYQCAGHCICDVEPICECEYKRMREITFINTIPTLFIRFNPHKYKTKGSMKSIAARHDELLRVLKQSLIDGPKARCEVKYLFYDESIEANQIVVGAE
jgi:hypothetical protein